MTELDDIQREFFKALLLPLRGRSRDSTDLAASDEGHDPEFFRIADGIIKPGPALTSAERLELYHRQYWFRILDSLAEDFPVLRRMSGEEIFWNLAEAYLLQRPSRSFTLRHLGEEFPSFIETSPELSEKHRLWFGSVARIEYAHMECFESAQGAIPEPADLGNEVIILQEHVKLLHLPVPADLCYKCSDFSEAATSKHEAAHIAVWRGPSGSSHQERIEAGELPLLTRLREGTRLAELFDSLPAPAPAEEDITRWFAKWHAHRWLGVKGKEGKQELDTTAGWDGMDRMSSQAVAMG